jgi:hypothetical protein
VPTNFLAGIIYLNTSTQVPRNKQFSEKGTFFCCKITLSDSNRRVHTNLELPLPFKMQPQHSHPAGTQDSGLARQSCEVFCWRLHDIGGIPLAYQAVLFNIYIFHLYRAVCVVTFISPLLVGPKHEPEKVQSHGHRNSQGSPSR